MPGSNVLWPTPLTRWPTLFPGQFGVPGTDSDRGLRLDSNGCIFWVDPNHVDANDQRDGTNPDAPFATVAAALTHCRDYAGDVIAVMHNGGWTNASGTTGRDTPISESVIVTVAGVRIVGVSCGNLGVPWMPTADNATCITVRAIDVTIEGFNFWNSAYAGTTGILSEWGVPVAGGHYYGDTVVIRHNFFNNLAYGIQLDFAWHSRVEDNYFLGCTTQAIHNPSVYGDPDWLVVRDNIFDECTGCINLPGTDDCVIEANRFVNAGDAIVMGASANNTIHGNTIQGTPGGTDNFIDLTGAIGCLVSDNYLACTIAQYDVTCSDATSGSWVNNHCTNGDPAAPPI